MITNALSSQPVVSGSRHSHHPSTQSSRYWRSRLVKEPHADTVWRYWDGRYRNALAVRARSQMSEQLLRQFTPDEILNQAMMRCAVALRSSSEREWHFAESRALYAWFYRQVDRTIKDAGRKLARTPEPVSFQHQNGEYSEYSSREPAGAEATPSEALMDKELIARLSASLQTIPSIYREVLEARYLERLSVNEIAIRMNRKPCTVSKQARRGLDLWREKLGDNPARYF